MVGQITDYVNVSVSITDFTLSRVGFGTPLMLIEHAKTFARTDTYTKAADLLTAGFSATSTAYLAALELTSQDRKPSSFKVGRKFGNSNSIQTISFNITGSITGTWTVSFDGATTSALADNITDTALASAMVGLSSITSVTVTGSMTAGFTVEFTGGDASTAQTAITTVTTALATSAGAFTLTGTVTQTQYGGATETWLAGLNAVVAYDNDWFMLLTPGLTTVADVTAMATVIEPLTKMYGHTSHDSAILTTDTAAATVASKIAASSLDKTFVMYSEDTASYSAVAWSGLMLPKDPGSATWAHKTLVGVTADSLTTTEKTNILSHNASYYETVAGRNITFDGKVGSGEYIDVIRGAMWIETRVGEEVFLRLAQSEKIPFTQEGAGIIEGCIRSILEQAVARGILIDGTISIEMPDVDSVSAVEKAARQYLNVQFSAQLQGAIHKTTIIGNLSV